MALVLIEKGLVLEGSTPQNRGQTGSRYININLETGLLKKEIPF